MKKNYSRRSLALDQSGTFEADSIPHSSRRSRKNDPFFELRHTLRDEEPAFICNASLSSAEPALFILLRCVAGLRMFPSVLAPNRELLAQEDLRNPGSYL